MPIDSPFYPVVDARHLTRPDGEKRRDHLVFSENRLQPLLHSVYVPSEAGCEHAQRLDKPNVAKRACRCLLPERGFRQPGADFPLKRKSSLSRIHDAFDVNRMDVCAGRRSRKRKRVHCITRVDART